MKTTQVLLSFLLCLLILPSCNSEKKGKEESSSLKIFRYNQDTSVGSLDPAFAKDRGSTWICNQLYNSLVQVDEGLHVKPSIAKSWEASSDGLKYVFTLRDDVYFHDDDCFPNGKGRKVTAQDVVYSFNRLLDGKIASPGAWLFRDKVAGDQAFIARGEQSFELNLIKPFRPIMGILSMQYCSIIPKESVDKYGPDFRSHPVGTGPFEIKTWVEGQKLILEKNGNYFEKDSAGKSLPKVDGVIVSFNENKQAAYLELLKGNLDMVSGIDASYKDEALTKTGELQSNLEGKIVLKKSPFLNSEYLGILLDREKNPALNDVRVRQALNYGFDRERMVRFLRNGIGKPAISGFTPPGLPSFNAQKVPGYKYDQAKARELMQAAGYSAQKPLELQVTTSASYSDLCTYIQNQFKDIGVDLKIDVLPGSQVREMMTKGQANFFRGSWIADYPDAESFFTVFYGGYPAPPNYTRFKNAEFDKLYEAALVENDDAKRHDIYQQMDRIIVEDAPIIPLMYDESIRFLNPRVSGLKNSALNLLDLRKVDLKMDNSH